MRALWSAVALFPGEDIAVVDPTGSIVGVVRSAAVQELPAELIDSPAILVFDVMTKVRG